MTLLLSSLHITSNSTNFLVMNIAKNVILYHILICVIYLALAAVYSGFLPLNSEDWMHFSDFTLNESWAQALASYMTWNARIGEMASYFVGAHALTVFHVVNPLVLLIAVSAGFKLATGKWLSRRGGDLAVLTVMIFGISALHSGVSWFIGNLNWLYPTSLALLFFALYDALLQGQTSLSLPRFVIMLPLAFVIGMSNENTSVTSLLFLLLGGYVSVRNYRTRPGWHYLILLLVMLAGVALFFLAPAAHHRAEISGWELNWETLIEESLLSPSNWIYTLLCYWRILAVAILLFCLCWMGHARPWSRRATLLFSAILISQGVLIVAPYWGAPRAYCLPEMLSVTLLATLFHQALKQGLSLRLGALFVLGQALVFGTQLVGLILYARAQYGVTEQLRVLSEASRASGAQNVLIEGSSLDLGPVGHQPSWLPRNVMKTEISPVLPLSHVKRDDLSKSCTDVQGDFLYGALDEFRNSGRRLLNIPMAKSLGLDSLIVISPDEE